MRIITWNCNMAFRKKAQYILDYNPDVLIIPECERPDKLKFPDNIQMPTDVFWSGENIHKGLGVFTYGDFEIQLHESYNPSLKIILPLIISNYKEEFILLAIWANNPSDPDGNYVEQVWKAINYYDAIISEKRTLLAGDFNSNSIWDRKSRVGNHSTVVEKLAAKNIHSTYHHFFNLEQGKEIHPTLFLYRHQDKPYHLDYCFASSDLTGKVKEVQVGTYDDWKQHSDHLPLIVTLGE